MPSWSNQPWRRDSNETASGKPGAVHSDWHCPYECYGWCLHQRPACNGRLSLRIKGALRRRIRPALSANIPRRPDLSSFWVSELGLTRRSWHLGMRGQCQSDTEAYCNGEESLTREADCHVIFLR